MSALIPVGMFAGVLLGPSIAFGSPPPALPEFEIAIISDQNGQTLCPGAVIEWRIEVRQTGGRSCLGLAGLSVDLIQASSNPATFDIPPATEVPSGMSNFSRPAGISNPQPGNPSASAYTGAQIGPADAMNLVQVGGMQNTFGVAGTQVGTNTAVVPGIGLGPSPQTVAGGTFVAPAIPGTYSFTLTNVHVTALGQINAPPLLSPAFVASTSVVEPLMFAVSDCCIADFNCSGGSPDDADIAAFFAAWNAGDPCADLNHSGGSPDDADIASFFQHWNAGC